MTASRSPGWRVSERAVIFATVAVIMFVPAVTRVHQHIGRDASGQAPHAKWSTSCESIPKKTTPVLAMEIVPIAGVITIAPLAPEHRNLAPDPLPPTVAVLSPSGLRAPPPSIF